MRRHSSLPERTGNRTNGCHHPLSEVPAQRQVVSGHRRSANRRAGWRAHPALAIPSSRLILSLHGSDARRAEWRSLPFHPPCGAIADGCPNFPALASDANCEMPIADQIDDFTLEIALRVLESGQAKSISDALDLLKNSGFLPAHRQRAAIRRADARTHAIAIRMRRATATTLPTAPTRASSGHIESRARR